MNAIDPPPRLQGKGCTPPQLVGYVETTTEQWVAINSDRQSPGDRTTQFIQDPEAIAQQAIDLLGSTNCAEIAAGLAVVVGHGVL